MLKVSPFLLFDGTCAEAMTFYHQCIGGDLTLTKLGETPMKAQIPQEKHDRIINSHLKRGDKEFSAADWMAAPEYIPKQGDTFSLFVTGRDYEELKPTFDKLSESAAEDRFQELHDMPFGVYGQFTDKFGVPWIFKGDKS